MRPMMPKSPPPAARPKAELFRITFTNRVGNDVELGTDFIGFPTREAANDRLAEVRKVDNPSFRGGEFKVVGPDE